MKKNILLLLILGFIAGGTYFFIDQKSVLPHDFNTLITLWQKERAKELEGIFGLWEEMPVGQGQRTVDFDIQYGSLSFSGKLTGDITSDTQKKLSLWKTQADIEGKTNNFALPLPQNIKLTGPLQLGQAENLYMIPGKMTVTLPSQSAALQSQLQQILDLASGKTLKIGEAKKGILDFPEWITFVEALNTRPIFLLARDDGEVGDRYEYTVSLAPAHGTLFSSVTTPMSNCQLSINKRNINDFILDCRSSDTRIAWSSHREKMAYIPQYKKTYEIFLSQDVKRKWQFDIREADKVVANAEGFFERKENTLTWETKTENLPTGYKLDLKGSESRTNAPNLRMTAPQSYEPWEELTKELVY